MTAHDCISFHRYNHSNIAKRDENTIEAKDLRIDGRLVPARVLHFASALHQAGSDALYAGDIGPQACLRQKIDLLAQSRGLTQTNRDPVDAAAGDDLGVGNVGEMNVLFHPAPPHLQMILAIQYLVREPVNFRHPQKIKEADTKSACHEQRGG